MEGIKLWRQKSKKECHKASMQQCDDTLTSGREERDRDKMGHKRSHTWSTMESGR